MKKLSKQQQKTIVGGGPCGKKICTNDPFALFPNATFTGYCGSTLGCNSAYVLFTTVCSSPTFCSTGL
jgi:hypothetical protein